MAEMELLSKGRGSVRSCTNGWTFHCAPGVSFRIIRTTSKVLRRLRWLESQAFHEPSTFSQPAGAFGPHPRLTRSICREVTFISTFCDRPEKLRTCLDWRPC